MIATRQGQQIQFEVADEPVILGRSTQCTVRLADPNVSRRHCRLQCIDGQLVVEDLQSQNGTLIRGERASRQALALGDTLRIGDTYVRYAEDADVAAPVAEVSATDSGTVRKKKRLVQADEALIGQVLAGYRIISVLGRGGYAAVYRAEQVRSRQEVALKVLMPGDTDDAVERTAAFRRERRAAAILNHPRLVRVHDVGEADGRHFLCMELVAGGTLVEAIRTAGRMSWEASIPILCDVLAALVFVHENDLVHRDVKPANILLDGSGGAKLADLGLALETKAAGTAAFMAPEQILRKELDGRTDLYALGCTAFAMLTGAPPFADLKGKERLLAHVRQPVPSLAERDVEVPAALQELIADLMAKKKGERPQSAAEALQRLQRIAEPGVAAESASESRLESEPEPASPTRARRARSRRHRARRGSETTNWLIALALMAVVAGVGYFVWKRFG